MVAVDLEHLQQMAEVFPFFLEACSLLLTALALPLHLLHLHLLV